MVAKRHRLRAAIFALLQMALSLGTAANLVFCSAASGHVAVESAFSADCCPTPPLTEAFGLVRVDESCGCVDTPLLQNPIEPRSRSGFSVFPALAVVPWPLGATDLRKHSPASDGLGHRPPAPDQRLAARRSIVLLV